MNGSSLGGPWTTGYVRVDTDLFIFMNIGVPGRTGHDFDNQYDPQTHVITWYGRPKSHSSQPTFKKLLNRELTTRFFARWDNKNPNFVYLGVGNWFDYDDWIPILNNDGTPSQTIRISFTCENRNLNFEFDNSSNDDFWERMGWPNEIAPAPAKYDPAQYEHVMVETGSAGWCGTYPYYETPKIPDPEIKRNSRINTKALIFIFSTIILLGFLLRSLD